jgi:hypothetical protein
MFDRIIKLPKNKKIFIAIFFGILFVGIFLRTYNFHDWLKFGPDQARDAILLEGVVNNQSPVPLLGPVAGGINFIWALLFIISDT